ncbi:MAG: IspD/TarI family cytidylyltransferase [Ktedonobacterales bacterium]
MPPTHLTAHPRAVPLSDLHGDADGERAAAVIVATDAGTAGDDLLWSPVAGKPLLAWTVAAFEGAASVGEIALVVARERLDEARLLWLAEGWRHVSIIAAGGASHLISASIGVEAISGAAHWLVIHDGARPLVTDATITAGLAAARRFGAASACQPVIETIKRARDGVVIETPDRASLVQLETPRVFDRETLFSIFELAGNETDARDEATVAVAAGLRVATFPGGPENIKVRTADDLALVESILLRRTQAL